MKYITICALLTLASCSEPKPNELDKAFANLIEQNQEVNHTKDIVIPAITSTELFKNESEKITIQFDAVSPVKQEVISAGTPAEVISYESKYDFSPTSAHLVGVMEFKNPPDVEDVEDYLNYMKTAMSANKTISNESCNDFQETKILTFSAHQAHVNLFSRESLVFWNGKLIKLVTMLKDEKPSEDLHAKLIKGLKMEEF